MAKGIARAKTPWLIKHVVNPLMLITGSVPILSVDGRRTGKTYRTPINVVELGGVRYLTSPRGETGWSRNLRATGECMLRTGGREQAFKATEVPPAERPAIIAAYLAKWGKQTRGQWDAVPDPADHPTFRLEPLTS